MRLFLKKLRIQVQNLALKLAHKLLHLVIYSCKIHVHGLEFLEKQEAPFSIALWHEHLLLAPFFFHKYGKKFHFCAVISQSRDGQALSDLVSSYPNTSLIRVAHTKRASALKKMLQVLQSQQVLIVTPDGPRGPRREVKAGLLFASKRSQTNILPWSWKASRCIKLKTWDRMCIPLPFSSIDIHIHSPIISESKSSLNDLKSSLDKVIH